MKHCYLIGMGGTGSKCVESFVHLAAAGLAPDKVWAGIVDQDQANGNYIALEQLLKLYQDKLYNGLRGRGHSLGASKFINTRFQFPRNGLLWAPLKDNRPLNDLFNYSNMTPELKGLFEALFSQNVREMRLEEGFMGQPNVGSATLLSITLTGSDFWSEILESLGNLAAGDELLIFLIGSCFGGTGAAALPSLGRLLKKKIQDEGLTNKNFHLGAAMMLPYFRFPPPPPGNGEKKVAASSEMFLNNARATLLHYNRLFQSDPVFESVYFVGWSPLINVNFNKLGGRDQKNPPMAPELYAALSAANFFARPRQGCFHAGRKRGEDLGWEDLPGVPFDDQELTGKSREYLGNLVRFAYAYLAAYYPYLHDKPRSVAKQEWFKKLISNADLAILDDNVIDTLEQLALYCRNLLEWSAGMAYFTDEGHTELFDTYSFAPKPENINDPIELIPGDCFPTKKFPGLITPRKAKPMHQVFKILNEKPPIGKGAEKMGVFVGSLYNLCALGQ